MFKRVKNQKQLIVLTLAPQPHLACRQLLSMSLDRAIAPSAAATTADHHSLRPRRASYLYCCGGSVIVVVVFLQILARLGASIEQYAGMLIFAFVTVRQSSAVSC